jgi:hypothetical protein
LAHAYIETMRYHRSCEKAIRRVSRMRSDLCGCYLSKSAFLLCFDYPCYIRSGDDGFRATSRLLDAAKVGPISSSGEELPQKKTPAINIAFEFSDSIFEWMSSPEQAWRGERLGKAMQQLHGMANNNVSEGGLTPFCTLSYSHSGDQIMRGTAWRLRSSTSEAV